MWKGNAEYRIPRDAEFHEIFIPTSDSIRHHFILQMLTIHSFPTLFLGKTGKYYFFYLYKYIEITMIRDWKDFDKEEVLTQ